MMKRILFIVSITLILASCSDKKEHTLEVTATAYNSLAEQTHKDHPAITAWGDTLKPGMKSIAVSRDLIEMGLDHNTEVKIKGLDGTYKVLDKMNKRWEKKIDIYFGVNREKALEWGKKKVQITWYTQATSD